ncbi:unnamed protein product, partial [Mesorhabditis spiculigera]
DATDSKAVLNAYVGRLKQVKQRWRDYAKERDAPYERSIKLIKTVHHIAQQNQHY